MFETERLILRAFRPSDADVLLSQVNELETQAHITPDPVVPRTQTWKEKPQAWAEGPGLFVIIESKETREVMGSFSLIAPPSKNREATVAITLGQKFVGKGHGTEVMKWGVTYGFKELGFHRIQLFVNETNERAVAAYKKVGFIEEGRMRKSWWKGGRFVDTIVMGILEDEWDIERGEPLAVTKG
ncbi:acyl-CoA N-acyltransferase [Gloeopeniophorella convolvens]|nr:acyl-CoA N-acyltransferase [Gloeopeniophorella convolvens]